MLKEQFRQLARSLMPREAPAPQPTKRRRRKEDTGHAAFRMAAKKIMRRPVTLPAAAYAAVSYLAETLDWLQPCHQDQWHQEAAQETDEGMQHVEYLSLHL